MGLAHTAGRNNEKLKLVVTKSSANSAGSLQRQGLAEPQHLPHFSDIYTELTTILLRQLTAYYSIRPIARMERKALIVATDCGFCRRPSLRANSKSNPAVREVFDAMQVLKKLVPLISLALFAVTLCGSSAKADESNKLTIFTFSSPIELPGVTLPAGTYTFKLMDSASDRNVVQVFNKDMTKFYATELTIPDYRPEPSDKTVVRFSETAPGAPPALKVWFYPGDNYGQKFVYPKSRAQELAKAAKTSVPSMPNNMTANITKPAKTSNDASVTAMKNTQLNAEQPNGSEAGVSQAFQTSPSQGSNPNTNQHRVNSEYAGK